MPSPDVRRIAALILASASLAAACGASDDELVERDPEGAEVDAEATPTVPDDASNPECPPEDGTEAVTREFDAEPPFCLDRDAAYSANITTSAGDFTIDFDQEAAPVTVNNFVFLARNNYFDDTVCHRVIQDFVVQCGDPTATGRGGPGYTFADELPAAGRYEVGSIAMANSGPDTNGSQFFIISGPNGAALPPDFSLFGQVTDPGLEVVADMNALGSLDQGGVPSEEVRIEDVEIVQS